MSLFLDLFYFKETLSNGRPEVLKTKIEMPWIHDNAELLTRVILSSAQGSGNQTNQTVHEYIVARAVYPKANCIVIVGVSKKLPQSTVFMYQAAPLKPGYIHVP